MQDEVPDTADDIQSLLKTLQHAATAVSEVPDTVSGTDDKNKPL